MSCVVSFDDLDVALMHFFGTTELADPMWTHMWKRQRVDWFITGHYTMCYCRHMHAYKKWRWRNAEEFMKEAGVAVRNVETCTSYFRRLGKVFTPAQL